MKIAPLKYLASGFVVAFIVVSSISKFSTGRSDGNLAEQGESPVGNDSIRPPAWVKAADLAKALRKKFLSREEWNSLVSGRSFAELRQIVDQQDPTFRISSPIAESMAYHLFGAMARIDGRQAISAAIATYTVAPGGNLANPTGLVENGRAKDAGGASAAAAARSAQRDAIGFRARLSCLRWAMIGIFENGGPSHSEALFAECSSDYWPGLIQGEIAGSDSGSVSDDLHYYRQLLAKLLHDEPHPGAAPGGGQSARDTAKWKARSDELLRSALDAWIERDPKAVLAWLGTDEGKPWRSATPRVIAALGCGNPAAIGTLALDGRQFFKIEDVAEAGYKSGWDAGAVRDFVATLPAESRQKFLAAYLKQLTKGSRRALSDFVDVADLAFLSPEVARALAPELMEIAPHLFDKLANQLPPSERDQLFFEAMDQLPPSLNTPEVIVH